MQYVPLGGDGITAPFAAYSVQQLQVTGDASGGSAACIVLTDVRYCHLLQYVHFNIQQGTAADADFRIVLGGLRQAGLGFQGTQTSTSATINANTVGINWEPTPVIMPGGNVPAGQSAIGLSAKALNVDGDVYLCDAYFYLFDIRVRELTPMGELLWARGST